MSNRKKTQLPAATEDINIPEIFPIGIAVCSRMREYNKDESIRGDYYHNGHVIGHNTGPHGEVESIDFVAISDDETDPESVVTLHPPNLMPGQTLLGHFRLRKGGHVSACLIHIIVDLERDTKFCSHNNRRKCQTNQLANSRTNSKRGEKVRRPKNQKRKLTTRARVQCPKIRKM